MKLSMDADLALQKMLGPHGYLAYTKLIEGGGITDYGRNDDGSEVGNIVNKAYALIAFKVLRRALYYTPVDTGKLRDSSYIKPYKDGYVVGYDCDYAVHVHEVGFNYHEDPTQYKFLEDAAIEVLEEHLEDTGLTDINIEYNPLRVFIGVKDAPGKSIVAMGERRKSRLDFATYHRLLDLFLNFDRDTGNEASVEY